MSMEELKNSLHKVVNAKMKFYNDMMEASGRPQYISVDKKEYNKLLKENAELKQRISDLGWQHDCAMGYVK